LTKRSRIAVVLAGGGGERFWPVSNLVTPKQLLKLTHPSMTMLEEVIERIAPVVGRDKVFISTAPAWAKAIIDFGAVSRSKVLTEPARRNTLGALVWVVAQMIVGGQDSSTLAIVTADHKIGLPMRFRKTISLALDVAESEGSLVTIGVIPTRAETGFGYIQAQVAEPRVLGSDGLYFGIDRFREKPSLVSAQDFLADARFFWNSGMLFFTIQAFSQALRLCQPAVAEILEDIVAHLRAGRFAAAEECFEEIPNISFDYAVMERAPLINMVPASFPWDDVGAWDSLERLMAPDDQGNFTQGPSTLIDSARCIVVNQHPETKVGVLGAQDMIVVFTGEALLVCPKTHAQRVRELPVAMLSTNP
jgi:mannose-1-phosphate guanylyltransferase